MNNKITRLAGLAGALVIFGFVSFTRLPMNLLPDISYPTLTVEPKAYRFRILNAANDRFFNLSLYKAMGNGEVWNGTTLLNNGDAGEVVRAEGGVQVRFGKYLKDMDSIAVTIEGERYVEGDRVSEAFLDSDANKAPSGGKYLVKKGGE